MSEQIDIGERTIGEGEPIYVIVEAGINHNGTVQTAKKLIKSKENTCGLSRRMNPTTRTQSTPDCELRVLPTRFKWQATNPIERNQARDRAIPPPRPMAACPPHATTQ